MAEVLGDVLDALFGVEQELGVTVDPRALVLGDGDALAATATHLRTMSAAFGRTADGLHRTDVGEWTGEAAEAFRRRFRDAPRQWTLAATAFERAAGAWDVYLHTVTWAQGRAAEAAATYRSGVQSSAVAVEAYNRQVADHNDRLGAGLAPAPLPPFVDPGTALIEQAQEMLTDARRQRDAAGDDAAGAVRDAAGLAPDPPSGWDQIVAEASDAVGAFGTEGAHVLGGIAEGTEALVKFVRTVNPLDSYNLTHPSRYLDGLSTTVAGLVSTAVHPLRLVPALTGTGWGSDPAESAGRLVPNVLLAIATGGVGRAVAGAGDQAALAGAERTALAGAEQAAMSGSVRTAARAASEPLSRAPHPAGPMTAPTSGGAGAPVLGRPPVTPGTDGRPALIADPRPTAPPFFSPPDVPPATGPRPAEAPSAPAAAPEGAAPQTGAPQTGGRIEGGDPSPHSAGPADAAAGPAPNPTGSVPEAVPPSGGHTADPPAQPVARASEPLPTPADPPVAPPPAANPTPNLVAADEAAVRVGAIDDGRSAIERALNPNDPPPTLPPGMLRSRISEALDPRRPHEPPPVAAPSAPPTEPGRTGGIGAADHAAAVRFEAIDCGRSAIDRALFPNDPPHFGAPTTPVSPGPVTPPWVSRPRPAPNMSSIREALEPGFVPGRPAAGRAALPAPGARWGPGQGPPAHIGKDQALPRQVDLREGFANEEFGGPSTWLPPGEQVRYLCGMERERQRLVIQDDRLLWAKDGSPLDTGAATTWDGRSRAIYVVDNRGNIYASLEQVRHRLHHSSLLAGEPVAAAGELSAVDGRLTAINRQSGHYQPPPEALQQVRDYLEREGIDMTGVDMRGNHG